RWPAGIHWETQSAEAGCCVGCFSDTVRILHLAEMTHMPVIRAIRNAAATCLGLLAFLAAPPALAQNSADTVVTHGKILTVDSAFHTVEALAIAKGRIVATGTSKEIARYSGKNTQVIDVAGATVIPGLIDNHFHFTRAVETWHEQARFEGVG